MSERLHTAAVGAWHLSLAIVVAYFVFGFLVLASYTITGGFLVDAELVVRVSAGTLLAMFALWGFAGGVALASVRGWVT